MDQQSIRRDLTSAAVGPVNFLLKHRQVVKFLLHQGIFLTAYLSAFLLRFEFFIPRGYLGPLKGTIPLLLLTKTLAFLVCGLFQGWWRFISIRDVLPILGGCSLGSLLFLGGVALLPGPSPVPRSVFVLDWGLTVLFVMGGRLVIRIARESLGSNRRATDRRVLIVGAGSAGQMIAREIRENVALGMIAVGFLDDDASKIGTRIHGLKVFGGHEDIKEVCRDHGIGEVVIAIPSARPSRIRHIVKHLEEIDAKFRILPGIGELIDGTVGVKSLRDVNIEDLLGRDPVELDTDLLRRDIEGRVVMVTGAAGSIGSELCRQVARRRPGRLVMYEVAESPLFELEREMRRKYPSLDLVPVVGDIRDRGRVREVVSSHRPSIVYHAAAYKHVPVMEAHPTEAVKNNVLGTLVVAEEAASARVGRFVLVSSDKAVRPTNVMGATKRVAELIIQNVNGRGKETVFVAVRFGNVLDSVGSVIPIFRKQLETTGKLTVTHPDATRYFMLIPEAAGLILQAGAMAEGGEVFVLEMGEPVRIVDLAKEMIRLSGKELGVNAEIVFTGLRPGEKLHEELVVEGEDVVRTSHPMVKKMIGEMTHPPDWSRRLESLIALAGKGDRTGVVRLLDIIVKGYTPAYDFHGLPAPAGEPAPSGLPALEPLSPASKSIH